METKPNFFIVGAPKSGTTALYSYLRQHPDIFMCTPKEPQFFAADICGHQRYITTLSQYIDLFKDARAIARGEASTCYLGSPRAPHEIRAFCPEARIIVMLRNPVDMMYAEHSERIFLGVEHISSFELALRSNEWRRWRSGRFRGQRVIRLCYRELASFPDQVNRFIDVFERSNIHIILYDDFAKNPALVYKQVLAFLGVWPGHECAFEVVNANRQGRNIVIQEMLRDPPQVVRRLVRACLPQPIRRDLSSFLHGLTVKVAPRAKLDPQLRKRLEVEFAPEVRHLSEIIDRDLSSWISG